MSTICLNTSEATYNLVAFPYDCQKYIQCTEGGVFVAVKTVTNNNVYNPENGQATEPSKLLCAVTKGKHIYAHLNKMTEITPAFSYEKMKISERCIHANLHIAHTQN